MTDLTINAPSGAGLRIGLALSQTWSVLTRAPGRFLLLSIVPFLPALFTIFNSATITRGQFSQTTFWTKFAVSLLLQLFLTFLAQAVIVYAAFQELRGQGFTLGDAVKKGLSQFMSVLGVSLLATILTFLGMIALIIPGIIVAVALYVAVPACVVERLGPVPSLRRSARLTKGFRGRIFGLLLIVTIAAGAVGYLIKLVLVQMGGILIGALGQIGVQAIATAFGTILVAIIYYNLRVIREGIDIDKIASVFD